MLIYRFEDLTGHGPFYGLDGKPFTHKWAEFDDYGYYGCESYEALIKYFEHQKVLTKGYHVYAYEVPRYYVKFKNGEVVFPKEWHYGRRFIAYNPFYNEYLNDIKREYSIKKEYSDEEVQNALREMFNKYLQWYK